MMETGMIRSWSICKNLIIKETDRRVRTEAVVAAKTREISVRVVCLISPEYERNNRKNRAYTASAINECVKAKENTKSLGVKLNLRR
jgi:hypothetical protein